jgi:hypothetical protein
MEHLWKMEPVKVKGYWHVTDTDGATIALVTTKQLAEFIVTACNEYYDNNRKAELFDELVVAYRAKFAINDSPVSLMVLVDEFAETAKRLCG